MTTKQESLSGMSNVYWSRKIGNNTFRFSSANCIEGIRLHQTTVVCFLDHKKTKVQIDNGGWETSTTKNRINRYANEGNHNFYQLLLQQKNYEWIVTLVAPVNSGKDDIVLNFVPGMSIDLVHGISTL